MEELKTKKCTKCNQIKQLDCFQKEKQYKDGYRSQCKECRLKYKRNWNQKNREKTRKHTKKWYQENKEQKLISNKKYKDTDDYREKAFKYYQENKDKYRFYANNRRLVKINATILGYDTEIKEIYKNCPEGHHVDHIHPLVNDNICGLNVPWNMQYLTEEDNLIKSNKFDGTYENESWKDNK